MASIFAIKASMSMSPSRPASSMAVSSSSPSNPPKRPTVVLSSEKETLLFLVLANPFSSEVVYRLAGVYEAYLRARLGSSVSHCPPPATASSFWSHPSVTAADSTLWVGKCCWRRTRRRRRTRRTSAGSLALCLAGFAE